MLLLNDRIKSTFQDAAKKLRGHHKCGLTAKIAEDYLGGSARKAERMFGWNRKSVQLDLHERNTNFKKYCCNRIGIKLLSDRKYSVAIA